MSNLPRYPAWVAARLAGIVADDEAAAVRWIVVQWIKDNEEWLAARGITFEQYRRECGGEQPGNQRDPESVLPFPATPGRERP